MKCKLDYYKMPLSIPILKLLTYGSKLINLIKIV